MDMDEETGAEPEPESPSGEEEAGEPTSPEETEEQPGESTSQEAKGDDDTDDEPEEWRNLVKKHEHIKDEKERKAAIGKAFWEKTRYASQVQKERDELKSRLSELEGSTPKPEKTVEEEPETSPDLQALEARTKALEAEQAEFPKIEKALLSALGEQDEDIAVLQYQLKTVLEEEKPHIQAQLRSAKAERSNILLRYHTAENRKNEIKEKLDDLAQWKRMATSRLEVERERQKQAERDRQEFQKNFPVEIKGYTDRFLDEAKVPQDEKLRERAWKTIKRSLMDAYFHMGGVDPDTVDHVALVKEHVKEYVDDMDFIGRVKLKTFSEKKADVVARLSPTIKPREIKPKEPARQPLPYEVNQRDERLEAARRAFLKR